MGHSASKQDKQLLQLKIQRDRLIKYKIKLESDQAAALQHAITTAHNKQHRNKALFYLRQKKQLQQYIDQVEAQQRRLFDMIQEIELKQVQTQILDALKQGNDLLSSLNFKLKDADQVVDQLQMHSEMELFDPIDFTEELAELDALQHAAPDKLKFENDNRQDKIDESNGDSEKSAFPAVPKDELSSDQVQATTVPSGAPVKIPEAI